MATPPVSPFGTSQTPSSVASPATWETNPAFDSLLTPEGNHFKTPEGSEWSNTNTAYTPTPVKPKLSDLPKKV